VPGGGAQAAVAVAPATTDDTVAKLKKLKLLLDQQLITKDEYESKKKEILAAL
jgi:hypothetical protein